MNKIIKNIVKNKSTTSKPVDAKKSFFNHKFYLVLIIIISIVIVALIIFLSLNSKNNIIEDNQTNNNLSVDDNLVTDVISTSDINQTSDANQVTEVTSIPEIDPSNNKAIVVDCDKNVDCFISLAKTCKLSVVDYTYIIWLDLDTKYTVYSNMEIKGSELNKCIVNKIITDANLIYDDIFIDKQLSLGKSMSEIEELRDTINDQNVSLIIGFGSTCKVDLDNLNKYLDIFINNHGSSMDSKFCIITKEVVSTTP